MRERRSPERGEQARVARRVRALLEGHSTVSRAAPGPVEEVAVESAGWDQLDDRELGDRDRGRSGSGDPFRSVPARTPESRWQPEPQLQPEPRWQPEPEGEPAAPDPAWESEAAWESAAWESDASLEPEAGGGGSARHAVLPGGSGLAGWLQRRGVRIDPGHRGGLAMGVAALIAALVAGWWVLSSRPHAVAVSSSAPTAAPTVSSSGAGSSAPATRIVVDVVGKVHHPGVYRLADGARVGDALHAAGGALPGVDLSPLNLARKLGDGEQIAVGVPGAGPPAGAPAAGSGPTAASTGSPIDLNTASLAQLDTLPGVGPVLAQRILDWRTAHGRFDSVDQLRDVTGIGDSRYADLKPLVTV